MENISNIYTPKTLRYGIILHLILMRYIMETFVWGIVFGIIGMGYFSFGKKRDNTVFLLSGIALMVFPYFVEGLSLNIIVGVILVILPFVSMKYLD